MDAGLYVGVEDSAGRTSSYPATSEVVAADKLRHVDVREEKLIALTVGSSTR